MRPGEARALAFLSGANILVVELVGTRLLSPVFGSTIYVWSALITVTLAALAVGAWMGGLLADGPQAQRWPARLCAAAGLWLACVPFLRRAVLLAAAGFGLKAGSLLAAAALVGAPLAALGALGPLCVRSCVVTLSGLGRAAGGISSISTTGSVIGALGTGFWLLPMLSAPVVVESAAASLLAAAALLAWGRGKGALGAAVVAMACAATVRGLPALGSPTAVVRESEDSLYGAIRVVDRLDWNRRVLYIDGVANTILYLDAMESSGEYIHAFELAAAVHPEARRALVIGLGGGAIVNRLMRGWGIPADVVEVDPTILRLAVRWFGFKPSGEVWLDDGRRVLERAGPGYGLIFLDAFTGDQNPEHIFTVEAFRAARRRLEPGGLLVVNLIGVPSGPGAGLARAAQRTLREVFPSVSMLVATRNMDDWHTGVANLIFYAGDSPPDPASRVRGRPELEDYWAAVSQHWLHPGPGGRLLSDDDNAMTFLGASGMAAMRTLLLERREGVDL